MMRLRRRALMSISGFSLRSWENEAPKGRQRSSRLAHPLLDCEPGARDQAHSLGSRICVLLSSPLASGVHGLFEHFDYVVEVDIRIHAKRRLALAYKVPGFVPLRNPLFLDFGRSAEALHVNVEALPDVVVVTVIVYPDASRSKAQRVNCVRLRIALCVTHLANVASPDEIDSLRIDGDSVDTDAIVPTRSDRDVLWRELSLDGITSVIR